MRFEIRSQRTNDHITNKTYKRTIRNHLRITLLRHQSTADRTCSRKKKNCSVQIRFWNTISRGMFDILHLDNSYLDVFFF
mmetsp:Transcript_44442/g.62361  ORF Transcript_44442/g.62361 Transcript_44442/m.62361 type:complete len:80 (-) Transcript_44442:39-278(-)